MRMYANESSIFRIGFTGMSHMTPMARCTFKASHPSVIDPFRRSGCLKTVPGISMMIDRSEQSIPAEVQGGIPSQIGHPVVAEVDPLPHMSTDGEWRTVIRDGYKFLWNGKGQHELYNLVADPGERNQLLTRHPAHAQLMQEDLETFFASLPARSGVTGAATIGEETRRALEGLGYVK